MNKNVGTARIDKITYVDLGYPQTVQEWHAALLLPPNYEVRNVNCDAYDRYIVELASECIPVNVSTHRITIGLVYKREPDMACQSNGQVVIFIDTIKFYDVDGQCIGEDKYNGKDVPHKHLKLEVSNDQSPLPNNMGFTSEEIALMFRLVKEGLAESEITSYDDIDTKCFFCDGRYIGHPEGEPDGLQHKDTCLILKARKLVADHQEASK